MRGEKKHNIGILGGTFDPVHEGHLAIARQVLSRFGLDTVLFIPALAPPHKAHSLAPFVHRVAMLESALDDEPGLGLSVLEAERPSPSYTVETLEEIHQRLGPCSLHLIVGADMFVEIELWYRYSDLFNLADLIVAARPGISNAAVARQVSSLPGSYIFDAEQYSWHRTDGFQIDYFPDTSVTISSSEIRRILALGGSVEGMVPAAVEKYIHDHQLYGCQ